MVAHLVVRGQAPEFVLDPRGKAAFAGDYIELHGEAIGGPPPTPLKPPNRAMMRMIRMMVPIDMSLSSAR